MDLFLRTHRSNWSIATLDLSLRTIDFLDVTYDVEFFQFKMKVQSVIMQYAGRGWGKGKKERLRGFEV